MLSLVPGLCSGPPVLFLSFRGFLYSLNPWSVVWVLWVVVCTLGYVDRGINEGLGFDLVPWSPCVSPGVPWPMVPLVAWAPWGLVFLVSRVPGPRSPWSRVASGPEVPWFPGSLGPLPPWVLGVLGCLGPWCRGPVVLVPGVPWAPGAPVSWVLVPWFLLPGPVPRSMVLVPVPESLSWSWSWFLVPSPVPGSVVLWSMVQVLVLGSLVPGAWSWFRVLGPGVPGPWSWCRGPWVRGPWSLVLGPGSWCRTWLGLVLCCSCGGVLGLVPRWKCQ